MRLWPFKKRQDPIEAARGAFKNYPGPTADEARRLDREEEAEIEERKFGVDPPPEDRTTIIVRWSPRESGSWLHLLDYAVTAIAESGDMAGGGGMQIEIVGDWYESEELAAALRADGWEYQIGPKRRWGPFKLTQELASSITGRPSEWPRLQLALERAWESDILPRRAQVRVSAGESWLATCHVDHAENFVAIESPESSLVSMIDSRLVALVAKDQPKVHLTLTQR